MVRKEFINDDFCLAVAVERKLKDWVGDED